MFRFPGIPEKIHRNPWSVHSPAWILTNLFPKCQETKRRWLWGRPTCWEKKHWCHFEGQSGNNEKNVVATAGHSKLQKIAVEKISSIFSVLLVSKQRVFPETGRRRGESILFLVRNSVLWPDFALLLARVGFAVFRSRKPVLVRSSVLSAHGTEFLTQK